MIVANSITVSNVVIPQDFCGIHTMYPATDPLPVLSIGNVRSYSYYFASAVNWYSIEQTAGVYTWALLDAMVTAWRQRGWTITWTLRGTPAFYTSDAISDGNGHTGGYGYPNLDTNLAATKAFVTAVINRYNSPSGAWRVANPTLGKGIERAAAINEPQFTTSGNFWHGTYTQSVDMQKAFYDAVKAADAAVLVGSPAFVDPVVLAPTFLLTSGTIYPAVRGAQTFDYLDFHDYTSMPYGGSYGSYVRDIVSTISQYQALNNKFCGGVPMTTSEYGFDGGASTPNLTSLMAEQASVRYTVLLRVMLTAAALGLQVFSCFRTGANFCGDLTNDTNGVVAAYNKMATFCGKTIVSGVITWGGTVEVVFSDGTNFTI